MEEVRLTLYLGLDQGKHPDLKITAAAAASFAALIEEMAYILDPSATVRVEAVSGTEASFGLNTLTRVFRSTVAAVQAGGKRHPKLAWLAAYVALRIVNNAVDWSQDQVMDWLVGKDAPPEVLKLSKKDLHLLAEDLTKELRQGIGKPQADAIYAQINRDPQVQSVGVTVVPATRPSVVVPRSEFPRMSSANNQEDGARRTVTDHMDAELISPILIDGDRRWRFRSRVGEFGAPMRDKEFMEMVLSGRTNIRLKAGLIMSMDVETTEVSREGAWVVETRAVTKVHGWLDGPEQQELLPPA